MLRYFRDSGILCSLFLISILPLCGSSAFAADDKAVAETIALGQAALCFRLDAQDDYMAALKKYANEGAQKHFQVFDAALWPATDPVKGWSFFFNTSLVCFGKKLPTGQTPVGFYNPWSDVFLLTVWRDDGAGHAVMTGAEVVMGDFIRKKGEPPFQTSRLWMRNDKYRPVAVGTSAAESLMAFDRIFRSGAAVKESWREIIPNLKDNKILEANYYGAGVLLAGTIRELVDATVAAPADDASKAYRAKLPRVLRQMNSGEISELLKEASGTLPEMQAALLKMPAKEWKVFRVTSFLPGKNKCMVMLGKGNDPDLYLGLLLSLSGKEAKLERMDLLSFRSFYEELAKNPQGAL